MSSEKKSRLTTLFILSGLLAGILIGFGLALVIQNRSITDVAPFLQSRQDTALASESAESTDNTKIHRVENPDAVENGDEPGSLADGEYDAAVDTLIAENADTLASFPIDGTEMVRRDELLGSRRIRLSNSGEIPPQKPGSTATADTLIASLTSVKIPEGIFKEYTLEFWRNPLNYKGYKTVRDKIILFGLPPELPYQLFYIDGNLVLQSQKKQYVLREASDFLPLTPRKAP
ncbi:MAG: hypothetical protein R6V49_08225 [Bacteroidales bacterium]